MSKTSKPRAGSKAYWPKKRAARMYPRLNAPDGSKVQPLGFAAYKAGMVRAEYTDHRGEDSPTSGMDIVAPVTILECPPLVVAGVTLLKLTASGWTESKRIMAEKLSKDLKRKTAVPKKPKTDFSEIDKVVAGEGKFDVRLLVYTQPKTATGKKKPDLFELPLGGKTEEKIAYAKEKIGHEIKAEEVFSEGEYIDVSSVTKGKGTQGPVKRFGIKVRPRKHEKKRRHVGSLGPVTPRRVLPGKLPMPGQLGFQTRTEYNKYIMKINKGKASPKGGFINYGEVDGPYMVLKGSVPGPKKRLIMIKKARRPPAKAEKMDVKELLLYSHQ